jgi:RNA-directed DNA polymerase
MVPARRWSKKPTPLGKPEDMLTWTRLVRKVESQSDERQESAGCVERPDERDLEPCALEETRATLLPHPKRIYRASQRGNQRAVHKLQKLLVKSAAARLLAVRRVTQENQGKKTAGVDGVKSVKPKERLLMAHHIHPTYWQHIKAQPVRRVWIPKPGKSEKRPLGIPTVFERARQCLARLALEPEWEARFEPNSYGFRPARSTHDAIGAIFNGIRYKPKYVLDADLKACFDNINQQALLNKLHTYTAMKHAIKGWRKRGGPGRWNICAHRGGNPAGGNN